MPLWGEKVSDDEINFEGPTPELFAQFLPHVTLKEISFKRYHEDGAAISAVYIELSNGWFDNFYNRHWYTHVDTEMINLNPTSQIREVAAHDG